MWYWEYWNKKAFSNIKWGVWEQFPLEDEI